MTETVSSDITHDDNAMNSCSQQLSKDSGVHYDQITLLCKNIKISKQSSLMNPKNVHFPLENNTKASLEHIDPDMNKYNKILTSSCSQQLASNMPKASNMPNCEEIADEQVNNKSNQYLLRKVIEIQFQMREVLESQKEINSKLDRILLLEVFKNISKNNENIEILMDVLRNFPLTSLEELNNIEKSL